MDASELTTVREMARMWNQAIPIFLSEDEDGIEDWVCISTQQDEDRCSGHVRANYRLLKELCDEVCDENEDVEEPEGWDGEYHILNLQWLGGWIKALVVPPIALEHEELKNALSLIQDGGCVDEEAVHTCDECGKTFDKHDSANLPFCSDWCESEFYRRPCHDCGWSFDIRDVDGDVTDEKHTCEDCVDENVSVD